MLARLIIWLMKKIYKRTMVKVMVLNRTTHEYYDKLPAFCSLEADTSRGAFIFHFKEDRRKTGRAHHRYLFTRTFIVELEPPDDAVPDNIDLNEKIVLAVKVLVFKPNYKILTQVLADIYLDAVVGDYYDNLDQEGKVG